MCHNMSDVRLSNVSPTVERADARLQDAPRAPVRRNLFGSVNRDEFRSEARDRQLEREQAFAQRWGYDIAADRPLYTGDFEWETVVAPEFYTRPPHCRGCPRPDAQCPCGSGRGFAEEREGSESATDSSCSSIRKRPGNHAGCPNECQSKRSRPDDEEEDDADNDQSDTVEKTPSKPEGKTG